MTEDERLLTAAVDQNARMRERIVNIENLVADLAGVMTGDRVQPSGRYGSAEEMLGYLIRTAKERANGR